MRNFFRSGRNLYQTRDLWVTEYVINYEGKPFETVSIMEFKNGKVVHETQYFAEPFEAPAGYKRRSKNRPHYAARAA